MTDPDWTDPTLDPVEAARLFCSGEGNSRRVAIETDRNVLRLVRSLAVMCERLSDDYADLVALTPERVRWCIMKTARHPDRSRVWPEV